VFNCHEIHGDSLIVGKEVCDDGNVENDDGCDKKGQVEKYWECDKSLPSLCNPICGDGIIVTLKNDILRSDK